MSVDTILREPKQVCQRAHTSVQLAADRNGVKVRNPLHPSAVAWSTAGALYKVSPRRPEIVAEHKSPGITEDGNRAYDLLEEAAREQGYVDTVEVDRAGFGAVLACFDRAIDSAQQLPGPRRKPAAGTGNSPRGHLAA